MARMARVVVPHIPHPVTQRGNRRQRTFFCDDDYREYVRLMAEYCRKAGTRVWAYCLMPNHVHAVMVPSHADGLREAVGEAHRRYTRHDNSRYEWRGHLWQERFHSFPMDESHLLASARYIERNPVAAGLCRQPVAWPWSSSRAHIDARDDALVDVRPMLERVSDWEVYLADASESSIGEQIEKHARSGRPLGSRGFVDEMECCTGRTLAPRLLAPRLPGRRKRPPEK